MVIWLMLGSLALFLYATWVYRVAHDVSLSIRRNTQGVVLSSIRMILRAEEMADTMMLTAEQLKMLAEGLAETEGWD